MSNRRIVRINSLLKEVISDVILFEVKDPGLPKFITITSVDITSDLKYAKVHTSIIGSEEQKKEAIKVLNRAAGFIAQQAAKEVVMRYFPELTFILDSSLDAQMRIEEVISKIQKERDKREPLHEG